MVLAARASGRNGRTLLLVVAIIVLGAILTLATSPVLQRANDAAPGAIEGQLGGLHATVRDLKAATPAGDGRAHVIEGKLDDLHATVRDLKAALEASSEERLSCGICCCATRVVVCAGCYTKQPRLPVKQKQNLNFN